MYWRECVSLKAIDFLLKIFFVILIGGDVCLARDLPPAYADSTYKHDPYDLSQVGEVDSTDVYRTPINHFLRLPQYAWWALVHPLGEFTIYAEHTKIWVRYFDLFTNEDGTIGIFPVLQIGGETGHGGGGRFFHTNLFNKRKIFTGQYVYSGSKGQFGDGMYIHPQFLGTKWIWRIEGGYLQTRHKEANINAAFDHNDKSRLFEIKQWDLISAFEWDLHQGPKAPFVPQVSFTGWAGFANRDFQAVMGGTGALTDLGSSPQARITKGLNQTYKFYSFGGKVLFDNRDYRAPVKTLSHPINYRFPGRIIKDFGGDYYYYRDIAYPERGGMVSLEGAITTGPDQVKFYQIGVSVAKYFTLFWKDRVLALHGRLDKVTPWGGGFVPYTELVQLGGNESMRGYERGYFRGQGGVQFNVEYRYPIWDTWNAFLFWDEGQIFDHYADLDWNNFHTSLGGGISFRTEVGLLGKIKIGHSAVKDMLIGFTFQQEF